MLRQLATVTAWSQALGAAAPLPKFAADPYNCTGMNATGAFNPIVLTNVNGVQVSRFYAMGPIVGDDDLAD
jgi:hypothetical protein